MSEVYCVAIFPGHRRAVAWSDGQLVLVDEVGTETALGELPEPPAFLSACPDGRHFAFWQGDEEKFRLLDSAGVEVWSRRINTDKALPHLIHFSLVGDAVACADDYDGNHRVHFYSIAKRYATTLDLSQSPLGFDAGLRRFVRLPFWDEGDRDILFLDRHGDLRGRRPWPYGPWVLMALQPAGAGLVMLWEGALLWLSDLAAAPQAVLRNCAQQPEWSAFSACSLQCAGDMALLRNHEKHTAILASGGNRRVAWLERVRWASLWGERALVLYEDGGIGWPRPEDETPDASARIPGPPPLGVCPHGELLRILRRSEATAAFDWLEYRPPDL